MHTIMKLRNILIISLLGFCAAPFAAQAQIALPDKKAQTVDLGYGVEQSEFLTTAATYTITAEELRRTSAISLADALYGKLLGLTALQNTGFKGEEGRGASFNIRGAQTTGETDILILVDGQERPIDRLSVEEVESVTVLRDAAAVALYRENQISADEVIAVYEQIADNIEKSEAKNASEEEEKGRTKATVESLFADSKVASCENLIAIFGPRYEANPNDLAMVSNIVRLMNSADDCSDNDLYLNAVTSMHKLDPSFRSAYGLYKLNSSRGNVADAADYLQQAIDSEESDAALDAQYNYEMAAFCYKNGLRSKALEAAKKAVELDNGFAGKAYLIMGNLWASATCGDTVDKWARYWVAADYYQKARNTDASLSDEAASSISSVARYYPEASEAFMYDLTKGQSYTVSCSGMTATTTVRVQ